MQIVDVLGHNAWRFTRAVQRSKGLVPAAGLRRAKMRLHRETPPPGLVARLLAGEEIRKVDRPHPGPDAAGGAEIRNAAFGGNAGSGEWDDDPRLVHQLAQAGNCGGNV